MASNLCCSQRAAFHGIFFSNFLINSQFIQYCSPFLTHTVPQIADNRDSNSANRYLQYGMVFMNIIYGKCTYILVLNMSLYIRIKYLINVFGVQYLFLGDSCTFMLGNVKVIDLMLCT